MANDNRSARDREPEFSFGTRELQEAERAERAISLALVEEPPAHKPNKGAGFDPYNTSGSFDRRKHWERIGKR